MQLRLTVTSHASCLLLHHCIFYSLLTVSCEDAAFSVSLQHAFQLRVPLAQLRQVKSIFVGGLPETVSEEKLQDVFKVYGEVGCTAQSRACS